MKTLISLQIFLLLVLNTSYFFAQSTEELISDYLILHKNDLKLTESDIQNWTIYDRHVSRKSGIEHIYIRQNYKGIELFNAVANFAIVNSRIVHFENRLVSDVSSRVNTETFRISPQKAILLSANYLGLSSSSKIKIKEKKGNNQYIFNGGTISIESIPVQLSYFSTETEIKLVWDLSIYEPSKKHWWSLRVDAQTGEVIDKVDWVVSCSFESCDHLDFNHSTKKPTPILSSKLMHPSPAPATDQYRVYGLPLESPNNGPRSLIVGPSDSIASPFGWHDDNGLPGAEYTVTQGNNVRATEDINNNNGIGFMPDGGVNLNFDYPLNFNNTPASNQSAAITNLFYWNNIMHDVYYQYGFDETSGNFQENNYGNGGIGSDYVYAEAMDGGGLNNANFATPSDGNNPTMQMYLWTAATNPYSLTINSPTGIAGQYYTTGASFGPSIPIVPITADFAMVNDGTGSPNEGCNTIINGSSISGKIALIYRGSCNFTQKVENAQNAGAIGVIMINNVGGAPIVMGGTSTSITIPSIMISNIDGAIIVGQLNNTVNGSIQGSTSQQIDGDFDNGIIAHEYGHGISNRLTGGPSASNCLSNAEQMGEGWSDWFGLMLTIKPGDLATDGRGMGTYAKGQLANGLGIRPTPYSTDFGINSSTYATTNNSAISQPHGIGYVWCTMLWDMNWALIDRYGFNSNIYNGTGGNNIAISLVIEALKLQPCNPGFVDGRDAILAADMLLYNGANQCLIWEVFANRGLGYSASQGSSTNRFDQVEAFDLPAISCNAKLDLTLFIEGYYIPNSNPPTMTPSLYNNDLLETGGLVFSATQVDSITIELFDSTNLTTPVFSQSNILSIDGSLLCSFPDSAVGNKYYIAIKSKNTIELWSAKPIFLSESSTYNFSNSLSNAYTDSLSPPMVTLAPNLFGIYMADLNQDGFIDAFDYSVFVLDQLNSSSLSNYFLTSDMNGDGFVDAFDYPVYNYNSLIGRYVQRP